MVPISFPLSISYCTVYLYDELDKPVVIDEIIKAVKSPQRDNAFGNGHLSNEYLSNLLIYCHHI